MKLKHVWLQSQAEVQLTLAQQTKAMMNNQQDS